MSARSAMAPGVLTGLMTVGLLSACSPDKAILLSLDRNVCVTDLDSVEVEVRVEGSSVVWNSDGLPGFLSTGPESIAIAAAADATSARIDAVAYLAGRVVGRAGRNVDLQDAAYVETDLELDGCACGNRDVLFCESFDDVWPNPTDWEVGVACMTDPCDGPFEVAPPPMGIRGNALRFTSGGGDSWGDLATTIWHREYGVAASSDLYGRAFVRLEATDPAWTDPVNFLALWETSNWWTFQGGISFPSGRMVGTWQDTMEWLALETVPSVTVPAEEWFCLELSIVGGERRMRLNDEPLEVIREDGLPTLPFIPAGDMDAEIELGATQLWFDASGWVIWYDEVALDLDPIPCPDPRDL